MIIKEEAETRFAILQGDAEDRLKDIQAGTVDCIFTSPNPMTSLGQLNKTEQILGNAYRVLKPDGSMFLHMEDDFDENGSITEYCSALAHQLHFWKWITRGRMIWYMRQKGHPTNTILINRYYDLADRNRFRLDYSYIYHFTQARYGYYFDEALRAFTNSSIFEEEYIQPDITEKKTGFSENLIALCLTLGCRPGGTVLDPFAGYGTTGVVALKLGYRFIGIEKDENKVPLIEKRLKGVHC